MKNNIAIKVSQIILIMFFLLFFINCNHQEQNKLVVKLDTFDSNCEKILIGKKTILKKVPIFTIDSIFYKFLDTIVREEKLCTFYDTCYSGFLFHMRKHAFFSSSAKKVSLSDLIYIDVANIFTYDYSKCYGIFEYGGFRFICDSLCYKKLLKKTDSYISVRYLDFEKQKPTIDDRWSSWTFLYKNSKLELYAHFPCYKGDYKYPVIPND